MINAINNIACLWWSWMAAMFWQVSLLIILIACIDTLIKRWAWPQLRYALWLLVLLKLVLPPGISMPGSLTGRLQTQFDRIISHNINEPSTITQYSPFIVVSESIVPARAIASQPPATFEIQLSEPDIETSAEVISESPSVRFVWQSYAFVIWLLGMTALGLWLISRFYHLRACQSRNGPADSMPQSFHRKLSQCAEQLKLRRVPRIVVTEKVVCPAVFGIFRPVLLMPKGYLSKLSRKGAEHMLLHELAHIKRGDTLLHSFYLFLQIIYWFNPLLWLARRQLIHLRELCCDATVARILKNKTNEYRQTLIDIARRFLTKPVEPGLGLLGLFEDTNRLLVRLSWLEKKTWRYQTMKNLIIITIITLMLVFVLPMAKAQEQPSTEDNTVQSEHTQESFSQEVSGQETELEFMEAKDKYLQALQILLAKYEEQYLHKELVDEEDFYQELKKTRDELDNKLTKAYELEKRQLIDEEVRSMELKKLRDKLVNLEIEKQNLQKEMAALEISQLTAKAREQASSAQNLIMRLDLENDYLQASEDLEKAKAEKDKLSKESKELQKMLQQIEQWHNSGEFEQWHEEMQLLQNYMQQLQLQFEHSGQEIDETHVLPMDADVSQTPSPLTMPHVQPVLEMSAAPPMPAVPEDSVASVVVVDSVIPQPTVIVTPESAPSVAVVPEVIAPEIEIPEIVIPQVSSPSIEVPVDVVAPVTVVTPPSSPPAGQPGRPDINVKSDEDGKFAATREMEFIIKIQPEAYLVVQNQVGNIFLNPGEEGDCIVKAVIQARADTTDEAEEIVEQVAISNQSSNERFFLQPVSGDDSWNNLNVELHITVPSGVDLNISTDLGLIEISNLYGRITCTSNVGSIKAVNISGQIQLTTNVGDIEFVAADDFSAQLQANTKVGSIESEFPLDINKVDMIASTAKGTIGSGEKNVSLTTEVGNIHIKKQSSADN